MKTLTPEQSKMVRLSLGQFWIIRLSRLSKSSSDTPSYRSGNFSWANAVREPLMIDPTSTNFSIFLHDLSVSASADTQAEFEQRLPLESVIVHETDYLLLCWPFDSPSICAYQEIIGMRFKEGIIGRTVQSRMVSDHIR